MMTKVDASAAVYGLLSRFGPHDEDMIWDENGAPIAAELADSGPWAYSDQAQTWHEDTEEWRESTDAETIAASAYAQGKLQARTDADKARHETPIDAKTARFLLWLAEDFVAMVECDHGQRNSGGDVIEALGDGFRQAVRQAKGRGIA